MHAPVNPKGQGLTVAVPAARPPRLLAIASGGGHWIELMRLQPAFLGFEVAFVSMLDVHHALHTKHRVYDIPDASRFKLHTFLPIIVCALHILIRERPTAIVTTGSAPMLMFILMGRLFGIRTLWIDSIANSEHLSTSGRVAKRVAHSCISQWENVAQRERIGYWGKIV